MSLVPIETHVGHMMALEHELDGPRPAKPGDQEVGGGAVAVHYRPANEIIDSCIESVLCHELRQRLHRQTQIVLSNDHWVGRHSSRSTASMTAIATSSFMTL